MSVNTYKLYMHSSNAADEATLRAFHHFPLEFWILSKSCSCFKHILLVYRLNYKEKGVFFLLSTSDELLLDSSISLRISCAIWISKTSGILDLEAKGVLLGKTAMYLSDLIPGVSQPRIILFRRA